MRLYYLFLFVVFTFMLIANFVPEKQHGDLAAGIEHALIHEEFVR
jgi:hypothetical protein